MGAFLSGLAGIGSKLAGGLDGGGGAVGAAAAPSRFQRAMGNVSSGLGSLSANMLGQPEPDRSQPLKKIAMTSRQALKPKLPMDYPLASPEGSMSRVPYAAPDFAPGTGGGFVT